MAESKNQRKTEADRRQESLPGTDFFESEAEEKERLRGEKIGSTGDNPERERSGGTPTRRAD